MKVFKNLLTGLCEGVLGKHGSDKKIGLVLGSGGPRGWAHIGVLKALDELKLKPDIICGCSAGALVGAAYAYGRLPLLEHWVKEITWTEMLGYFDISFSGGGLLKGKKVMALLADKIGKVNIEELDISFAVLATDLNNGKGIVFDKGPLIDAVKASISMPGLLGPQKIGDNYYLDGAINNPLPVSVCKKMGADIVIAVNLVDYNLERKKTEDSTMLNKWYSKYFKRDKPNVLEVISSAVDIMQHRLIEEKFKECKPDILISPNLLHYSLLDFHKGDEAITTGYDAVMKQRKEIEGIMNQTADDSTRKGVL